MPAETPRHRLSAIMAADVVGYSRLMSSDEDTTVVTLTEYREQIADLVAQYGGRVVDFRGDDFLAELPSVLEAVRAALHIQREISQRNASRPPEQKMEFRIGIHLGDVRVEGERIYGDGVNIASRLEGLCEPGGVCVSAAVYEQVRTRLDADFEDLGEREVKNIPYPVHAYRLHPAAGAAPPARLPAAETNAPSQPAIAVLPFENLSADPDQDSLADAIAVDLIFSLSAWKRFPVISRSSSFTYKGRAIDAKRIGQELGARYVVEGTIHRAANRVRISAELTDATTGHHLWGERYDRPLDEIFDVQDEVTESIVGAIQPALRRAEADRARRTPPENLDAWAIVNRALIELQSDLSSRETAESAIAQAEHALALDANYALAHGVIGHARSMRARNGWAVDGGKERDEALAAAQRGVALAPDDPLVQHCYGATLGNLGGVGAGLAFERSLALDPYNAQALAALGATQLFVQRAEEGIENIERAMRLSPRDPLMYNWLGYLAMGCVLSGRWEEAVEHARTSVAVTPTRDAAMMLTIALGHLGRLDEARLAYGELRRISGDISADQWETMASRLAGTPAQARELTEAFRRASAAFD